MVYEIMTELEDLAWQWQKKFSNIEGEKIQIKLKEFKPSKTRKRLAYVSAKEPTTIQLNKRLYELAHREPIAKDLVKTIIPHEVYHVAQFKAQQHRYYSGQKIEGQARAFERLFIGGFKENLEKFRSKGLLELI